MDKRLLVELKDAVAPQTAGAGWAGAVGLRIERGEGWAVLGPSGAGKSELLSALAGTLPLERGRRIVAEDARLQLLRFGGDEELRLRGSAGFSQARWHSWESEGAPVAGSLLPQGAIRDQRLISMLQHLGVTPLLERPLLQLSDGEWRRLSLAAALMEGWDLLLLDEPFAGLDAAGRSELRRLLAQAIGRGATLALATTRREELPAGLPHQLELSASQAVPAPPLSIPSGFLPVPPGPAPLIRLRQGRVAYGKAVVLDGLDWTVQAGERWLIQGPNGSGKSTLLALVNGDHPQAYSNDLQVFGHARGPGLSVWDLKRRIGMVDPAFEAHLPREQTLFAAVLAGLFEAHRPSEASPIQEDLAAAWVSALGLDARTRFGGAGALQRRLALLGRALIKQPSLLLCDEACRGLGPGDRGRFLGLIDQACAPGGPALVWVSHHADELPAGITQTLQL